MQDIFLSFLNVSIEAAVIICALALLRIVLKKCPAYIRCILWAIVALRLIVPVSIESALSLMPERITVSEQQGESASAPDIEYAEGENTPTVSFPDTDIDYPESTAPTVPDGKPSAPPLSSAPESEKTPAVDEIEEKNPWRTVAITWIVGMLLMICYVGYNLVATYIKTRNAAVYKDRIRISTVKTPFVYGFFKPRIYLPANLTEEERFFIIAHENAHIKRGDHVSKIFAFLVLALHWFNPFVWLGYVLFCRDVELACDERVIKNMSHEERQAYSFALLKCTTGKLGSAYSLLAFGEVGTKERVKKVMNYKKPALWAICIALAVCIVIVTCFATRPRVNSDADNDTSLESSDSTSEDTTISSEVERVPDNYATGCNYDVYRNRILFQNGNGYLNGYDDTGFEKLTDGIVDNSVYESGYGDTDKNALYVDSQFITIIVDLGKTYDDIDRVNLRNLYVSKNDDVTLDYFSIYMLVSEDSISYQNYSTVNDSSLIHETTSFLRRDYSLILPKACKGRYIKLEIHCNANIFGLSEIEVYPSKAEDGSEDFNLEWSVSNDCTLTIKGTGNMNTDSFNVPWNAFSRVITRVVIEDGVTSVGDSAFRDFTSLQSVSIPDSVTKIGDFAFDYCSALKSVKLPDGVKEIETAAFRGCSSLTDIFLPDGITSLPSEVFYKCTALSEIKLPNTLLNIERHAFYSCTALKSISLPDTVTVIDYYAFSECNELKIQKLPSELKTVAAYAFPDEAFGETLYIPKNVVNIEENALGKFKYAEVDKDNAVFSSENGAILNKSKTTLFAYPVLNTATHYSVPKTVKEISPYAFNKAINLKTVTLPEGLTSIGNDAFAGCSQLQSISLPNTVKTIGSNAFQLCVSLTKATLPSKLDEISDYLFDGCTALKEASIPNGVTVVGQNAFFGCKELILPSLPDSINEIKAGAFGDCIKLNLPLPKNLKSIGSNAFMRCSFDNLNIPDGVTDLADEAFSYCRSIKTITIPTSIKKMYLGTFNGCIALEKINYGGTVKEWLKIEIDPFVDGWANVEYVLSASVNCTDGIGDIITVQIHTDEHTYTSTAYMTCDGTVQGIVDALTRAKDLNGIFNSNVTVNSFVIEKTDDPEVKSVRLDLSASFSKGFEDNAERADSVIYTLVNTVLYNITQTSYKDEVQITVNGKPLCDSKGNYVFKSSGNNYSPYVPPPIV